MSGLDKNVSCSCSAQCRLLIFSCNPLFLFFRHLDFFEMVRNEDEKELARKFEKVSFCQ
jgi:hypothetical protein